MRKALIVAAAVLLPLLVAAPAAQAQTSQICGNGGSGYCINAWNGGPYVKMYYGGYSNDNFHLQQVYVCSGYSTVQSKYYGDSTNCPFSDAIADQVLWTDPIEEVVYGNNGECIGTTANDAAYLGSCGNIYGTGAIDGAFDVLDVSAGCDDLYNRYWSNAYGVLSGLTSGGNPGTPLSAGYGEATCWGISG